MKRLLFLLIGVVGLFLLAGCGGRHFGDYRSRDFEHINHWEDFNDLGYEDPVFVYIYSRDIFGTYRQGNVAANEEVYRFGMENEFGLEMILINSREMQGDRQMAGVASPTMYHAQLLLVEEGLILEEVRSAREILEWIEAMEDGEYDWPITIDENKE